jgi:hypothetical protein
VTQHRKILYRLVWTICLLFAHAAHSEQEQSQAPDGISLLEDAPGENQESSQQENKATSAPAGLRADAYGLLNKIVFPQGQDDIVFSIACSTPIYREGDMDFTGHQVYPPTPEHESYCLDGDDESFLYRTRILNALKRSKMVPARANGRNTAVSMKFTTIFKREDMQEVIYFVPNWYLNNKEFGSGYYAPQLIHHSVKKNSSPRCLGRNVVLRVVVDAEGNLNNPRHEQGKVSRKCLKLALKWAKTWKFIPGTVQGEATEMTSLVTAGRSL